MAPGKVARAEEHFRELGIRVVTGHRYFGGFIGDAAAEREWLKEKVQRWTKSVSVLAGVAHKHPQSAYAGLKKSLQLEWAFVQRVTPGVGEAFGPVEEALREIFVPALFRGLSEGLPERENTCLMVKQAVLALPYPVQTDPENWTASCVITGELVAALKGQVVFRTADHSACLRGGAAGRASPGGETCRGGADGSTVSQAPVFAARHI